MTFEYVIEFILHHEGGYVFDGDDPGGETNFGISKRSYPNIEIDRLTPEAARIIYKTDFWLKYNIEALPGRLRLAVMDYAVHSGGPRAIRVLQRILEVKPDGILGPLTAKAAHSENQTQLLKKYLTNRAFFLTRLKRWKKYGHGWLYRVFSVQVASTNWRPT